MPIFYYDTKDAVPAELLDAAQEVTEGDNKGKFGVNVVARKKMEEFRDNNIEISKRLGKSRRACFKGFVGNWHQVNRRV